MNLPRAQFPARPPRSSLYEEALGLSLALRWLLVFGTVIWLYPFEAMGVVVLWILAAVALYGSILTALHVFGRHPPLALAALLDLAAIIALIAMLSPRMSLTVPAFAALVLAMGLAFSLPGVVVSLVGYGAGEVVSLLVNDAVPFDAAGLTLRAGSLALGAIVLAALVERHESLRARLARVALKERYLGVFDLQNFARALEYLHKLAVRGKWHYSIMVLDVAGQRVKASGHGRGATGADDTLFDLVGNEARSALRSTDLIGRVGEAMFAIALPETGVEGAEHVADRLRERLKEFNSDIEVTVGLAGIRPTPMDSSEDCLHSAFAAMREAKSGGEAIA